MRTFTFVLSSSDHRLLDTTVANLVTRLASDETKTNAVVMPSVKEETGRIHYRKVFIESTDQHVMEHMRHVDIQNTVSIKGIYA